MPVEDFIKLATDEILIKEYQALTILQPQKLEGNVALTNKRAIFYTHKQGLGESQLAMDIHLDQIRGINLLEELRIRWWIVVIGIILSLIGVTKLPGDQFNFFLGIILIIIGIIVIVLAFVKRNKTFLLEIKASDIPPLSIGRENTLLIRPGPDIDALIRDIGALVLEVQHNPAGISDIENVLKQQETVSYSPTIESDSKADLPTIPVPDFVTAVKSHKKIVIPIVIAALILVSSIWLFSSGLLSSSSSSNFFSDTPTLTPSPTVIARTSQPTVPTYTSRPTTKITTMATPAPLGSSATVALPFHETMQLSYNKIYRNFTSPKTTTITYDVIPNQITEEKEISSKSGYSTKMVTYTDPNSYLVITVRDAKSGKIIDTNGFGRTFSTSTHQNMIIRQPGDLNMEITGSKVTVSIGVE